MTANPDFDFRMSAEVDAARRAGRPLVALESTLISHGLPYPENIEVAQGAEAAVRDAGAVPATMAVLEGHAHVGLTKRVQSKVVLEYQRYF